MDRKRSRFTAPAGPLATALAIYGTVMLVIARGPTFGFAARIIGRASLAALALAIPAVLVLRRGR